MISKHITVPVSVLAGDDDAGGFGGLGGGFFNAAARWRMYSK